MTNVTVTDELEREDFIAGSDEIGTTEVVIASGQTIPARQPIAINTTTGKAVPFVSGGSNGAGVAAYISVYPIDSTAADVKAQVYKSGTFNADLVEWSGTPSDAVKMSAFAGTPISLQTLQD